jgi:hypothetical protein
MTSRLVFHGLATSRDEFSTGNLAQIDSFWTDLAKAKGSKTTLVAIQDATPFAAIKRKADLYHGVQTVCVLVDKIRYYPHDVSAQLAGYQASISTT